MIQLVPCLMCPILWLSHYYSESRAQNQTSINMEVDSGASVSLISKDTYDKLWPSSATAPPIQKSNALLQTYTGEKLARCCWFCFRRCPLQGADCSPTLDCGFVGSGPSLFGRDWLLHLTLDWKSLHRVALAPTLADLLDCHKGLFCDELGTLKGITAKLHVDPQSRPRFYKPRPVLYAMREQVARTGDRAIETRRNTSTC